MTAALSRAALAAGVLAALALAGCGGTEPTTTVTVTEAVPSTAAQTAPVERSSTTPRRGPAHPRRAASSGRRTCDANVSVKTSTTSCAFGENVFYGYWKAQDQGDDAFEAYSPIAQRSYAMSCSAGSTVICRAGDGGEVRFPQAAVAAYDAD